MIGIVLAGGQSRRFGRDKATYTAPGHDKSNVQLAVSKLMPYCATIAVSVNEHNRAAVSHQLNRYAKVKLVNDQPPYAQHGPLSAIAAVTATYPETNDYLMLAVDYPYLTARTIKCLATTPYSVAVTTDHVHYTLAHFAISHQQVMQYLQQGDWRLRNFISNYCGCRACCFTNVHEFINLNYYQGEKMKAKNEMSEPDFQKLLALVLNDLTIRRTMLENREQEVSQQLSSLERDAELEQLDDQIHQLQNDFNHYREFCDPHFNFNSQQYFQGPSMGLPNHP